MSNEQPVYLRPPERLYPPGYAESARTPSQAPKAGQAPKFYFVNPFKVSPFLKLLTKRSGPSTVRSKNWALKIIAEVYDARFQALKDPHWRRIRTASFVHEILSRRYGVKSIVDKMCWELYQTLQKMRGNDTELDMFAWFLDELFDGDDLTFFVEARQKVLWSQEVEKDELITMSALGLREEQVVPLVNHLFGNGAPGLSDRVIERARTELSGPGASRPLTVASFLDVALEEFRLHFDKPFPKIEAVEEQNTPVAAPSADSFAPATSMTAPAPVTHEPAAQSRTTTTTTPAVAPQVRLGDATASEWQFPLIVELREQLVVKNQRIFELEEKLLAQGEGRAKVEGQLRQLRHSASQQHRDSQSERAWVEHFLQDAGYDHLVTNNKNDADYGHKLLTVFNDKQAEIEDLQAQNAQLETRNKAVRSNMQEMGHAGDELLRSQDENHRLQSELNELYTALANAEASREEALLALEQAQVASTSAVQQSHPVAAKAAAPSPQRSVQKSPRAQSPPVQTSPRDQQQGAGARSPQKASAAVGGGASHPMVKSLTETITDLEQKKNAQEARLKNAETKLKTAESELFKMTQGRNEAEETVVLLEEESKALRAELQQAKGTLGSLESQEQTRFEAAIADERAQHQEEIGKMKQQMSGVMEKVMMEWDRVKRAAKKSVSVEEWLRLEDELKAAEKKNEELQLRGGGGGGGGAGGPAVAAPMSDADPDVYGHQMATAITNVEQLWGALKAHGSDWRSKGDVLAPASDAISRAVQNLNARYDQLEQTTLAIDHGVEDMVAKAEEGQIPEAIVDRLTRAIKDGFEELKTCKVVKASPEEVVHFMERVVTSLQKLGTQLAEAESDYCDKANSVLLAERSTREKMQQDYARLRSTIEKVPPAFREKLHIHLD